MNARERLSADKESQQNEETRITPGAPYESVLLKTVEKLRDQLLLFLLGYAVLIVVLAVTGSEIIDELRYLLYVIPVLGVAAYVGLTYLRMREEGRKPVERREETISVEKLARPAPVEEIPPSLEDDRVRVELLAEVRAQMSRLLTFAGREILPYPHPTDKRNEEAKYFFIEKSERLASQLGELGLHVSPDVAKQGENVYEMFDALWRMAEREAPRAEREAYLTEIREGVEWFTDVARQEVSPAPQAVSGAYKAKLGRELRGEMRSLLTFAEREVLPYPHQDERQNRDAAWYFKERTERISAGLGLMALFADAETLRQGSEALQQFEVLWTMASEDESAERRREQQERITRAIDRFDLLLKRELAGK